MENKNLIPAYPNQNKILIGLFWLSVLLLFYIFSLFIWIIGASLILYIVIKPFNEFLKNYIKNKTLCVLLVSLGVLAFIVIPLIFILVALTNQTIQLYQHVLSLIDSGYFQNLLQSKEIALKLLEKFDLDSEAVLNYAVSHAQQGFVRTIAILTPLITLPIILLIQIIAMMMIFAFLLGEGKRLGNVILKIMPIEDSICKEIYAKMAQAVKTLISGNLIVMVLHGCVIGITFWIVGIQAPLLWGTIAGLISILPVIGTTLVWIPAALYCLFTKGYLFAIILSLVCFVGYNLLESFLKPLLLGGKLNFNPIVIFFLVVGGLGVFGISGVIVGPLVLVMVYTLYDIYMRIKYPENGIITVKKPKKVRK